MTDSPKLGTGVIEFAYLILGHATPDNPALLFVNIGIDDGRPQRFPDLIRELVGGITGFAGLASASEATQHLFTEEERRQGVTFEILKGRRVAFEYTLIGDTTLETVNLSSIRVLS